MPAEPTAQADRGRHHGLPRFDVLEGSPGSFACAFARKVRDTIFEDRGDGRPPKIISQELE
jgi:hypothetical protein